MSQFKTNPGTGGGFVVTQERYQPPPPLPCPFCGGPAHIRRFRFLWFEPEYTVVCASCDASAGMTLTDRELAIRVWNHRAPCNHQPMTK